MKHLLNVLKFAAFAFGLALFTVGSITPSKAEAVSGSDWRAGRIIDDSVFTDANSMSVGQIQDFLNAKGGFLASWRDNLVVPFPDKYDVNGNICYAHLPTGMSSAEIIHEAATNFQGRYVIWRRPDGSVIDGADKANYTGTIQSCHEQGFSPDSTTISSKALLTMLQKEQAIVTATGTYSQDPNAYIRPSWPSNEYRIAWAMGYAVPDTGSRQHRYKGFYNQVGNAARQLRRYMTYPQNYNFGVGSRFIRWHPNSACGSGQVNIETAGTAALYNYTPYQPNATALSNIYGSQSDGCSSYGNRNFWRIFNDWFGSTIGPSYSWSIESFSYSGGDNVFTQGQTETLTLRARNNGRVPWYNHGSCPVRLGTWGSGRNSIFANGTWLSPSKITTVQESVVLPGEVGTFTFQVTPGQQGSFVEGMNLVAENCEWAAWPGFSPTFIVTGPYSWQIYDVIYDKGTGLMEPGTRQLITVKAKNTGTTTWSKTSGPPIWLGTWQPGRSSSAGVSENGKWPNQTRATDMNEGPVAPGDIANFQFWVQTPSVGNFYERMNLVAEGQTWLNDAGLTLYLRGGSYGWQYLGHTLSTPSANIPRNTDFTITLRVKNTGEVAWRKSAGYQVRLATVDPLNRGTALYHSSWINGIRPVTHTEDVVLPGQEGTFVFTARTPNDAGPRSERFSLVAEGVAWFNDPGMSIYVNVQ